MIFTLALTVWCSKCHKREKTSAGVFDWSTGPRDARGVLIERLTEAGWRIVWTPRQGVVGPNLCPKCNKERKYLDKTESLVYIEGVTQEADVRPV